MENINWELDDGLVLQQLSKNKFSLNRDVFRSGAYISVKPDVNQYFSLWHHCYDTVDRMPTEGKPVLPGDLDCKVGLEPE